MAQSRRPPDAPNDFDQLPRAQQAIAFRTAHAVRLYEAALQLGKLAGHRQPAVTAAVLPLLAALGLPPAGRSTLAVWRRAYRAAQPSLLPRLDRRRFMRGQAADRVALGHHPASGFARGDQHHLGRPGGRRSIG